MSLFARWRGSSPLPRRFRWLSPFQPPACPHTYTRPSLRPSLPAVSLVRNLAAMRRHLQSQHLMDFSGIKQDRALDGQPGAGGGVDLSSSATLIVDGPVDENGFSDAERALLTDRSSLSMASSTVSTASSVAGNGPCVFTQVSVSLGCVASFCRLTRHTLHPSRLTAFPPRCCTARSTR
jgi:hypothetical protein